MPGKPTREDQLFELFRDFYFQTQIKLEADLSEFHKCIRELPDIKIASSLLSDFGKLRKSNVHLFQDVFIYFQKTFFRIKDKSFYPGDTWISAWVNWSFKKSKHSCEICGESRVTDWAHIIPRSRSGKADSFNTFYFCPTHHKLFDKHQLSKEEWRKLDFSQKAPATQEYVKIVIEPRLQKFWNGDHKYQ